MCVYIKCTSVYIKEQDRKIARFFNISYDFDIVDSKHTGLYFQQYLVKTYVIAFLLELFLYQAIKTTKKYLLPSTRTNIGLLNFSSKTAHKYNYFIQNCLCYYLFIMLLPFSRPVTLSFLYRSDHNFYSCALCILVQKLYKLYYTYLEEISKYL